MPPFERPHALFRRSEADEYIRAQPEPRRVATLNVPARRNVDGHDGDVGAREERERGVEWGAHGRLEGKAEDRVEHDVARRERCRERALRLRGVRRGERRDLHVRALLVQALHLAVSNEESSVR
jgi:hypothetical protein